MSTGKVQKENNRIITTSRFPKVLLNRIDNGFINKYCNNLHNGTCESKHIPVTQKRKSTITSSPNSKRRRITERTDDSSNFKTINFEDYLSENLPKFATNSIHSKNSSKKYKENNTNEKNILDLSVDCGTKEVDCLPFVDLKHVKTSTRKLNKPKQSHLYEAPLLMDKRCEPEVVVRDHFSYVNIVLSMSSCKEKNSLKQHFMKYNFLSLQALKELNSALRSADRSKQPKAILLSSVGPVFCSGINIMNIRNSMENQNKEFLKNITMAIRNLIRTITELKKPLICAVQGPSIGFGATLALYSDLVFASESAILQWPCMEQGIPPIGGVTFMLKHLTGNQANSYLMLGKVMSVETARLNGIYSDVFSCNSFMQHVFANMNKLVNADHKSLVDMKSLLKSLDLSLLFKNLDRELSLLESLASAPLNIMYRLDNYINTQLISMS